ncbi:HEAT repeat-containing protein [Rivularia sp. PCC 7116]|uniref:HEAT repeat domain-containing protein n=1 Tax=Rivularia sp. PCC 7116 TaxID=373994 RepID=UPI00029F0367|nr:HEAT repeat domain-containing protein [Rivularia sp. PCC 7116]AFY52769.1 HEAT repeat-containing protein [Rivularia sp. PCC 7116]
MNQKRLNVFLKYLQISILSLGLSFISVSKAWGEEISDSALQQYGNNLDDITEYELTKFNVENFSKEDIDKVLEKLKSQDTKVRAGAVYILSSVEDKSPSVLPAIIQALQDENSTVRSSALHSLGEIGKRNESVSLVIAIIQALKDKDVKVRSKAALALNEIEEIGGIRVGEKSKVLLGEIPTLIKALQNKDAEVRRYGAMVLGNLGKKAISAVPELIKALEDENSKVRSSVAEALGDIGDKAALKPLLKALQDKNSKVRSSVAEALGDIGDKAALQPLLKALQDKNSKVRSSVAEALGDIGDKAALQPLLKALQDKDSSVRSSAAYALGNFAEKKAIQPLIKALKDDDLNVRSSAADALEKLEYKPTIESLKKSLKNPDLDVRLNAASYLSKMGKEALLAVPEIIIAFRYEGSWEHELADSYVSKIVKYYRNQAEKLSNQDLENGIAILEKSLRALEGSEERFKEGKLSLQNTLKTIRREQDYRLKFRILEWVAKNPWITAAIFYIIIFPLLWSSLLLIRPLWLLKLNHRLQPLSNLQLPEALGGWKLSISGVIFLEQFSYHPRVLDAWVGTHIKIARDNFSVKETVSNRAEYISLPVVLDKKTVANFSGNDLKACFTQKLTNILIHAEGGSGKTSLACQLVKWGMSDDINIRPSKHRMLPVLIEQELDADVEDSVTKAISGQLQVLIGEPKAIPSKLVEQLLLQRRILVIIDHFSEMSEATRKQIRPASPNFPANALIVTSRLQESLDNVPKTTIKPLRVSGNQLSSFMEAYLTQRGKRDLFDDAEYFDACRRLSLMVGKRNITALFAKLYAEQMIAKAGVEEIDSFVNNLPLNIPDLMLGYINELNRETADSELDNPTVQKDAKIIAWECLKNNFRPSATKLDDVVAVLDNPDTVNARLQHLEKRLRIIQINEPGRNKVRLALDPLAEYLAGLYLVDNYGQDKDKWVKFLDTAKSVADLGAIQGFLLAVQDCCIANPEDVPNFVANSLCQLTGVVLQANQNTQIIFTN